MRKDPTPQDAHALLFGAGLSTSDYFLFRVEAEDPWNMCRRTKDGGMVPVVVEDEALADLCRMVLLTGGATRYTSLQDLQAALGGGRA